METKTPRSYHERVQAARKEMWMRENERLANPPKVIDWTATLEAGKVVYKKTNVPNQPKQDPRFLP